MLSFILGFLLGGALAVYCAREIIKQFEEERDESSKTIKELKEINRSLVAQQKGKIEVEPLEKKKGRPRKATK